MTRISLIDTVVGIDIVDHSDPLLHKRNARAFRLITNPADEHSLSNISEEQLFWLFWSAKESIYKTHRRLQRFDPKKIAVSINKSIERIEFQSDSIKGFFDQNEKYTLAVCGKIPLDEVHHKIFNQKARDQSSTIRSLMAQTLTARTGHNVYHDQDKYGLPMVRINNQPKLATFTHHHMFMGFICEK